MCTKFHGVKYLIAKIEANLVGVKKGVSTLPVAFPLISILRRRFVRATNEALRRADSQMCELIDLFYGWHNRQFYT